MAKRESKDLDMVFIPGNVLQTNRILGFKTVNVIEGVIEAVLFAFLVWAIPFVLKVKIIISIVCGLVIIVVNAVGIHGYSLLTTFLRRLAYKPLIKRFHYRRLSPDHVYEDITDDNGRLKKSMAAAPAQTILEKFNLR